MFLYGTCRINLVPRLEPMIPPYRGVEPLSPGQSFWASNGTPVICVHLDTWRKQSSEVPGVIGVGFCVRDIPRLSSQTLLHHVFLIGAQRWIRIDCWMRLRETASQAAQGVPMAGCLCARRAKALYRTDRGRNAPRDRVEVTNDWRTAMAVVDLRCGTTFGVPKSLAF